MVRARISTFTYVEETVKLHNRLAIAVYETVDEFEGRGATVLTHVTCKARTFCQHGMHWQAFDAPEKNDCERGPGMSSKLVFTKFHLRHS